jgi:tetratricopeptide (TPR) repeat protein
MSLIIARKIKEQIFLVSDTKLTNPKDDKLYLDLRKDHVFKITILNHQLVFAFAGNEEMAESALKRISKLQDVKEICTILLNAHQNSHSIEQYEVEFILAIGAPDFKLVEFKNGSMLSTESSYIGSTNAFKLFQGYFVGEKENEIEKIKDVIEGQNYSTIISEITINYGPNAKEKEYSNIYSSAVNAMRNVIRSEKVEEVGGFCVPVVYDNGLFCYQKYLSSLYGKEKINIPDNKTAITLSFGNKAVGSYAVNLLSDLTPKSERYIAFHFFHGEFGLIFERTNDGLPRPTVISTCDAIDFSLVLKNRYFLNEPPIISLGFLVEDFKLNGKKHFENGDFQLAYERLTFGIVQCEKDPNVWMLYGARASVLMKLKKYKEALNDWFEILRKVETVELEKVYSSIATAFLNIEKYKHGIKYLNEVLKINPSNGFAYYNRSLSYFNIATQENSREKLNRAKSDLYNAKHFGYLESEISLLEEDFQRFDKYLDQFL